MALRSCQPFLIIYKSEISFLIPSVLSYLDISLVDFIHHNKACFEHTLPPSSSARVSMLPVPFVKVSLQGVWSQCVSLIIFIGVHCWECNLMGKWSFSAHLVTTERVTEKLLRFVHFRLQMWQSRKTGIFRSEGKGSLCWGHAGIFGSEDRGTLVLRTHWLPAVLEGTSRRRSPLSPDSTRPCCILKSSLALWVSRSVP